MKLAACNNFTKPIPHPDVCNKHILLCLLTCLHLWLNPGKWLQTELLALMINSGKQRQFLSPDCSMTGARSKTMSWSQEVVIRRQDLRVILMSATVNEASFAAYLGNCPTVHIPGFTFPVRDYFLEDVLELTRYRPAPASDCLRRFHAGSSSAGGPFKFKLAYLCSGLSIEVSALARFALKLGSVGFGS